MNLFKIRGVIYTAPTLQSALNQAYTSIVNK
jgi:hypothetical protein